MDDLLERVSSLEKGQGKHSADIKDIYGKLGGLQSFEQDANEKFNELYSLINQLELNMGKTPTVIAPSQPA